MNKFFSSLICIVYLSAINFAHGFSVSNGVVTSPTPLAVNIQRRNLNRLSATETDEDGALPTEAAKKSLEDKMKDWEASEEEMKNASLGGVVPGRTDGFDIGLFIAFPFIVGSALLFAVFPFIMDKIDVSSVGPPPTV